MIDYCVYFFAQSNYQQLSLSSLFADNFCNLPFSFLNFYEVLNYVN